MGEEWGWGIKTSEEEAKKKQKDGIVKTGKGQKKKDNAATARSWVVRRGAGIKGEGRCQGRSRKGPLLTASQAGLPGTRGSRPQNGAFRG